MEQPRQGNRNRQQDIPDIKKLCPLKFTQGNERLGKCCEYNQCMWYDDSWGACGLVAIAQNLNFQASAKTNS